MKFVLDFYTDAVALKRKKLNYAFVEIVAINQIMAPYILVLISSFRYINNLNIIYISMRCTRKSAKTKNRIFMLIQTSIWVLSDNITFLACVAKKKDSFTFWVPEMKRT